MLVRSDSVRDELLIASENLTEVSSVRIDVGVAQRETVLVFTKYERTKADACQCEVHYRSCTVLVEV